MSMRRSPNIAIAGTPGTGKSTLCEKLRRRLSGFTVVDFGREAELRGCRESYDEELECWIIEEDELAEKLESEMEAGGNIVDYMHANDFWPQHGLIDLVVTLRTNNTILFDRYKVREYNNKKIEQNIDCEIMNDIGIENKEYYQPENEDASATVVELISDDRRDMKRNVDALVEWVGRWQARQNEGGDRSSDGDAMPRRVSFAAPT